MNEFEVHYHSDEHILERVKNIDWLQFYIEFGKTIAEADIVMIKNIWKFRNFASLSKNAEDHQLIKLVGKNYVVKIPFYFYDAAFSSYANGSEFKKISILLEQEVKGIFYVGQRLKDLSLIFDTIDNQEAKEKININSSKKLRALKYRMVECFYDDVIRMYLTLLMDFIYDCQTLTLNGEDIQDESYKLAKMILSVMNKFDSDMKQQYGGDELYDKIKTEIPNPIKKEKKKSTKKKTKNITLEEKKE